MDSTLPYSLPRETLYSSFNPPLHFKRSPSLLPSGPWMATAGWGGGRGHSRSSRVRSPGYRGHSRVQADFFKRHHFSRHLVFGFVHNSVRALSDLFHFLEVLHEALASRVSPALERGPGNPAESGTQLSGAEEGKQGPVPWPQVGMERSVSLALVNLSNLKQCYRLPPVPYRHQKPRPSFPRFPGSALRSSYWSTSEREGPALRPSLQTTPTRASLVPRGIKTSFNVGGEAEHLFPSI